jgi:hypothetical protein
METGIELVVRVLVGGAAIRPSVGRPHHVLLPESGFSDQCADDLVEGLGLAGLVVQAGAPADQGCPCRKSHPRSSCGMLVLMKHSTESVVSSYAKAGDLIRNHQWHGQWLERAGVRDALMRPVPVVEKLELPARC